MPMSNGIKIVREGDVVSILIAHERYGSKQVRMPFKEYKTAADAQRRHAGQLKLTLPMADEAKEEAMLSMISKLPRCVYPVKGESNEGFCLEKLYGFDGVEVNLPAGYAKFLANILLDKGHVKRVSDGVEEIFNFDDQLLLSDNNRPVYTTVYGFSEMCKQFIDEIQGKKALVGAGGVNIAWADGDLPVFTDINSDQAFQVEDVKDWQVFQLALYYGDLASFLPAMVARKLNPGHFFSELSLGDYKPALCTPSKFVETLNGVQSGGSNCPWDSCAESSLLDAAV
jgi:hypothetical protein